jgi:hypothetical protein
VSRTLHKAGVVERAEAARETLSTAYAVEALIVLFEAFCLRREVLGDRHAFTIPGVSALGLRAQAVAVPDMFLVLTSSFWGPALLWLMTSVLVPVAAAYLFNFSGSTGRNGRMRFATQFDPMTFAVAKGLITYAVYIQDYTFGGLVDLENVARLNSAMYGGPGSVLIGSAVAALVTMWEALAKN